MNIRRFKNSFLTFFFVAALFVAWLEACSSSHYQQRMTLLIGVLLLMLCAALALAIAMPSSQTSRKSPQQQRNDALLRHQPASAQFKVRMNDTEQKRRPVRN